VRSPQASGWSSHNDHGATSSPPPAAGRWTGAPGTRTRPRPTTGRPRHDRGGGGGAGLCGGGLCGVPAARQAAVGELPGLRATFPHYRPHQANQCGHELCHGLYAATCDPARVARWWARWPQANIGARVPANLLVIDVDPRHGGLGRLAELEREHGPLPPTRVSISGRSDGGQHLWFLYPGGRLWAARLGAGVDLKTHAGYVLLPPSQHPATGRPYRWAEPILAPAALPAGWRRLLSPTPPPLPATRRRSLPAARGRRVAEAFNQATSWTQVLGPHGWTCPDSDPDADGARWRHPGATNPKSATIRHGLLFVYSQATPFQLTEAGAPRGYSRFRAYAVLEHGGDLRAAARALRGTASR
jgi:Bifunctional DNA primase/polymerase, N-terminal